MKEKILINNKGGNNNDKKIILASDAHWGERMYDFLTQGKFKSEEVRKMLGVPKAVWLDVVFNRYRQGNERRFELLLKEIQKVGDVKYLFFGGDMVSGYGERGLSGENSQEAISEFKKVVDSFISEGVQKHYVAGDHEMGYYLPWSWDEQGGLNERAIEMFEGNFNELFYTFNEDQYKFVILSSDLELVDKQKEARGVSEEILRKQSRQRTFYKDEISGAQKDEKIVLMLHDPDALQPMFDFLEQHLDKIERTFVGHHHAQWVTAMQKYLYSLAGSTLGKPSLKFLEQYIAQSSLEHLRKNSINAKIWNQMKMVTIPAPGGNFGLGGGFLVAKLGEDGLDIQKHNLPTDFGLLTGK